MSVARPSLNDVLEVARTYKVGQVLYLNVYNGGFDIQTDYRSAPWVKFSMGPDKRKSVRKALDTAEKQAVELRKTLERRNDIQ